MNYATTEDTSRGGGTVQLTESKQRPLQNAKLGKNIHGESLPVCLRACETHVTTPRLFGEATTKSACSPCCGPSAKAETTAWYFQLPLATVSTQLSGRHEVHPSQHPAMHPLLRPASQQKGPSQRPPCEPSNLHLPKALAKSVTQTDIEKVSIEAQAMPTSIPIPLHEPFVCWLWTAREEGGDKHRGRHVSRRAMSPGSSQWTSRPSSSSRK